MLALRRRTALAVALAAAGLITLGTPSTWAGPRSDQAAARAQQDSNYALVQLAGDPLSTAVRTRPARGKKIDFSSAAAKSYRAQLTALRNDYKAWLRKNVPSARVTGEFDIALNAVAVELNGASLAQVAATSMVASARYQALYHPLDAADPDLALIDAIAAWNQGGGAAGAGAGVKVAVVDAGIDVRHPCFADDGYTAQKQLGDTRFTNNKVIVAKVFNNKIPQNQYTAEAIGDHGTHVAGTVACNLDTPAVVQGVSIPYAISGVAPRALLGNYNVFPADVASARSEDILNALEAAYQDGFDVANMSLGGGAQGFQDLLTVAVDNLDRANMVVAVAAGNSGPGYYTIESPGSAARALTAGASTVPHFVGAPVTVGGSTYGAASGDFATVTSDLTAPLAVPAGTVNGLSNACSAFGANSLAGQIALVSRGTCTFSTKIRNAQSAGAVAVLVANNVAGDPTAMGSDGTPNQPTVPAYMVSMNDGQALKTSPGASTTISANLAYFATTNADIMAGFSSQGPTDVDFRVKPDVVAPGVNVLSSVPAHSCDAPPCFAFFQGTSMAAPHLAGSAAVLRAQHPQWSAADVRSAIVNTAERGVLMDYITGTVPVTDGNVAGAGRENLLNAAQAIASLDPVSLSFGAVASGGGQTKQMKVTLTNISAASKTFTIAVNGAPAGVTFGVDKAEATLAAGASTVVTVTMSAGKRADGGPKQAWLEVGSAGASAAHAVLFAFVK